MILSSCLFLNRNVMKKQSRRKSENPGIGLQMSESFVIGTSVVCPVSWYERYEKTYPIIRLINTLSVSLSLFVCDHVKTAEH